MRENKFRVYCEFEVNGELHRSMESSASWFLLSQTGKLWTYGPTDKPRPIEKEYKKAIPLFYTGLKDKNGKEIYEGDICRAAKSFICSIFIDLYDGIIMTWAFSNARSKLMGNMAEPMWRNHEIALEVIGNIYENPELLKEVK